MIAPGHRNENSPHIFPDSCLGRVSFLPNDSSFGVIGSRALIRLVVRPTILGSNGVVCFGSLCRRRKAWQDGDAPSQRSCQRLPSLAEKNRLFLFCLCSARPSLGYIKSPRGPSLEKSRTARYGRICLLFSIVDDLLRKFLCNAIWEVVWGEPSRHYVVRHT